jgi:hypothetical protein
MTLLGTDYVEFSHDLRSAGSVDRAIHSAASSESGIRRIYDRVDGDLRDIASDQLDHAAVRN